eukprot:49076-Eustigmatos_ZCMA.PRE.1
MTASCWGAGMSLIHLRKSAWSSMGRAAGERNAAGRCSSTASTSASVCSLARLRPAAGVSGRGRFASGCCGCTPGCVVPS